MVTYFVIYDPFSRMFVRSGKYLGWSNTLNTAKHFTSKWSADNFMRKSFTDEISSLIIKKIQRF